ncbi:TetR/AcrR family transcriptional regulator [Cellulomonas sp. S1-8]|uniref:TetR/AcrR family transcriptional regulator n=1 Tax=Cellulomonas sp. S1-8 TaxID=2904790 RepID=UPI002244D72E|nr:TetR/AcrR family transcriptional regulator [Cellulomonas sp. S1-8]UZN03321.1 TetR/AcrR family transcriptional regulator [Cellulomonas sp. S1-8]
MASTDPRSVRSREAILDAARGLLVEHGPAAVTHVQVADRAGVGRATVYRHWPQAHDLLSEAMSQVPFPFFDEPTTPVRAWLKRNLEAIAAQLRLVEVRAVATTLANGAIWDAGLDARRQAFADAVEGRIAAALTQAAADGEVTLRVDPASAAAILLGPAFYRATFEVADVTPDLIEASLDAVGTWTPGCAAH